MIILFWILVLVAGTGVIVWGAEAFAEHLGAAAVGLGVSSFALALLLAGAEPEELATSLAASFRGSPGIALGDVIGANVTICLVALGVGAIIRPIWFGNAFRYAAFGLPMGFVGMWMSWDGKVSRLEGGVLVLIYIAYVAAIWIIERRPPALGEVGEIDEARERVARVKVGHDLSMVLAGIGAMSIGATVLVEAVRRISSAEGLQTELGLTIVGFATGFELVVLAWSASRRGKAEAAVAGVVGSFTYNVTMTLGAAALARPLTLHGASALHIPLLFMMGSLALVILLTARQRKLSRMAGALLLSIYPLFVILVFVHGT